MSKPMPDAAPMQQDDEDPARPVQEREPQAAAADAGDRAVAGPGDPEAAPESRESGQSEGSEQSGRPGEQPAEDDGPRPLGLRVTPTGHAPVDAQLRRLEDADHLAVSGHLEVYEDVHRGLRDTLSALDRPAPGPGRPAPGHPHTRS